MLSPELVDACRPELVQIEAESRPGTLWNVGPRIAELAGAQPADSSHDRLGPRGHRAHPGRPRRLPHRGTSSTRSSSSTWRRPSRRRPPTSGPPTWAAAEALLDRADCPLPASSLYAIAALDLGLPYINFTPSLGAAPAGIDELARLRGTCHAGRDGKTGETLLKSVLAPMFAARNLQVMSWVGHNIFGNLDGRCSTTRATSRPSSRSRIGPCRRHPRLRPADAHFDRAHRQPGRLENGLGSHPFPGFSGHADDAAVHLAGVRFAAGRPAGARPGAARRRWPASAAKRARSRFLSSFFKSPLGDAPAAFADQFRALEAWVRRASDDVAQRMSRARGPPEGSARKPSSTRTSSADLGRDNSRRSSQRHFSHDFLCNSP